MLRGIYVDDNLNINLLGFDEDDEDILRIWLLIRIVDDVDDFVFNEKDCFLKVFLKFIIFEEFIFFKDERNMFLFWRFYIW